MNIVHLLTRTEEKRFGKRKMERQAHCGLKTNWFVARAGGTDYHSLYWSDDLYYRSQPDTDICPCCLNIQE